MHTFIIRNNFFYYNEIATRSTAIFEAFSPNVASSLSVGKMALEHCEAPWSDRIMTFTQSVKLASWRPAMRSPTRWSAEAKPSANSFEFSPELWTDKKIRLRLEGGKNGFFNLHHRGDGNNSRSNVGVHVPVTGCSPPWTSLDFPEIPQ